MGRLAITFGVRAIGTPAQTYAVARGRARESCLDDKPPSAAAGAWSPPDSVS